MVFTQGHGFVTGASFASQRLTLRCRVLVCHAVDTASLATWFLFGKLVCVATVFDFGEKRCRKNLPFGDLTHLVLMPLPDFTDDERYLINCAKSTTANAQMNSYMWGYVIAGSILAGFGAYQSSIPMMFAAFVVVVSFRIYEELFQSKWLPLWRSVIAKYEAAALGDVGDDGEPAH